MNDLQNVLCAIKTP